MAKDALYYPDEEYEDVYEDEYDYVADEPNGWYADEPADEFWQDEFPTESVNKPLWRDEDFIEPVLQLNRRSA